MKKFLIITFVVLAVGFVYFFVKVDKDAQLRGTVKKSPDGKTYLVVADDNGGGCGPIIVDGKNWPHKINEPGSITPGPHSIECGGKLELEVLEGTTFFFDYWGP